MTNDRPRRPLCFICSRVLLTDYELALGACAYCDHRADNDPDWYEKQRRKHGQPKQEPQQ